MGRHSTSRTDLNQQVPPPGRGRLGTAYIAAGAKVSIGCKVRAVDLQGPAEPRPWRYTLFVQATCLNFGPTEITCPRWDPR